MSPDIQLERLVFTLSPELGCPRPVADFLHAFSGRDVELSQALVDYLRLVLPEGAPTTLYVANVSRENNPQENHRNLLFRPACEGPRAGDYGRGNYTLAFSTYRKLGRLVVSSLEVTPHVAEGARGGAGRSCAGGGAAIVARHLLDPERLADELLRGDVEGVSILGGEPFEQAAACAALARRVQDAGRTVVTYSGYTVSDLRASTLPEIRALIAASDLLIAGPYLAAARNDGRGWHGSTNQEMVFLSDRYGPEIFEVLDALPVVELRTDGERLDCTGIPAPVDIRLLYTLERGRHLTEEP